MKEYHKINSLFKRDQTNPKIMLEGDFSVPEFAYLANNQWEFTEKVDGTNIRVICNQGELLFGGKTDDANIPPFLLKNLEAIFLPLKDKLPELIPACLEMPVTLYGEGYGAKIQKGGGNYRQDTSFVLFDVKIGDWWLKRDSIEDIASKLQIDVVPVIGYGTIYDLVRIVREGLTSTWGPFAAEGLIAKPALPLLTRSRHRIITKLKTVDFKNITKVKDY